MKRFDRYYFLDLIILILSSPIILPIFAFTVFITLIRDGKPIFYSHQRIGLGGKSFELFKIRSMDNSTHLCDDLRITSNGHFIRDWSLDELPQLLNVLKGEMSLVGPRPLITSYRKNLSDKINQRRHSVKPGITGWAQIHGRNILSWEEKIIYDLDYVQSRSLLMNLKILFLTIPKVISQEGIYTKDGKMMPELSKQEIKVS